MSQINIIPIGQVTSSVTDKVYEGWGEMISYIEVNPEFADGLIGLEEYSHAIVVFYMDAFQNHGEQVWIRKPRGLHEYMEKGCFAQRTKYRPNPIGITAVEILGIEKNVLAVKGLDANDKTSVLDIKPYISEFDSKENVRIPLWMNELMKNYF
ncbi:tRNA (N6-threonylcarbamoyladenosine(37)-N6)-methyltransferase TrmO [Brevibacillus laterosporus]|nr:tRNA (N6-threonylcarbamoyladenosine(37)-N6)-methyltransferase TrmO [Brevibacillus laterosporus]TPG85657.1 tRNA (N6-threonylcarbamoyladenosine(37)-N6)-methyltransferase TrmO [Brevibacillus laterosporus]